MLYIDSKKLLFLGRLYNMPSRFLPKQIFITRLLLYLNNCITISGGFIPDIIKIRYFHFLDDGNELVFTKLSTYENRSYFLTIFMISGIKPPLIVIQLFKYNNRRVMNICFGLWNNLTNNEIVLLERAHRYVCKYVQGLPKLTRTDKCTTLLGWTSIECYIDSKTCYKLLGS
jgi:hypothetical protein